MVLTRIIAILGTFWNTLFKDLLGLGIVQTLASIISDLINRCRIQLTTSIAVDTTNTPDIYSYNIVMLDYTSIRKAAADIQATPAGQLAVGIYTRQLYVADIVAPGAHPVLIQDSATQPNIVLMQNIDYVIAQNKLYTTVDPRTLGAPVLHQGQNSAVSYVIRLFGVYKQNPVTIDAFQYVTKTRYDQHQLRNVLWQLRIQGPTCALIQRLCASVLQCPVAVGAPDEYVLWTQATGQLNIVYTTHKAYISRYAIVSGIEIGTHVTSGMYLFTGFRLITTVSDPAISAVDSIIVKTTAGSYIAQNRQLAAVQDPVGSQFILPLTELDTPLVDYTDNVKAARKANLPAITIPEAVNPMQFILRNIMRERFVLLGVASDTPAAQRNRLTELLRTQLPLGTALYTCDLT